MPERDTTPHDAKQRRNNANSNINQDRPVEMIAPHKAEFLSDRHLGHPCKKDDKNKKILYTDVDITASDLARAQFRGQKHRQDHDNKRDIRIEERDDKRIRATNAMND